MEERKKAVKRKSSARGGVRPKAQAGNLFKGLKNTVAQIEFVLLSNINSASVDDIYDSDKDQDYVPTDEEQPKKSKTKKPARSSSPSKPEVKVKSVSSDTSLQQSSYWADHIPYEILLRIFEIFLSDQAGDMNQIELLKSVCVRWGIVADDPKLWRCVNMYTMFRANLLHSNNNNNESASQEVIKKFQSQLNRVVSTNASKFSFIVDLNLSNLAYLTLQGLKQILSHCRTDLLKSLDISNCKKINHNPGVHKTDESKQETFEKTIGDHCSKLVCLNVSNLGRQLSQNGSAYMFTKMSETLEILNLSGSVFPTANYLMMVGEKCPNLIELDLSNSAVKGVTNLDLLSTQCVNLRRFHLLNTDLRTKFHSVPMAIASPVGFTRLEHVSISNQGSRYDSNSMTCLLAKIAKDSQELKTVDLRNYKSPLEPSINIFSIINSDKLERLYLPRSMMTDADSDYLASAISDRWSKSLIIVDLTWSNISQSAIDKIIGGFVRHADQAKLRSLDLTGTCVHTESVVQLIRHVKSLVSLDLKSCRSVDRGMKKELNKHDLDKIRSQ